jgi:hypothetical protein
VGFNFVLCFSMLAHMGSFYWVSNICVEFYSRFCITQNGDLLGETNGREISNLCFETGMKNRSIVILLQTKLTDTDMLQCDLRRK